MLTILIIIVITTAPWGMALLLHKLSGPKILSSSAAIWGLGLAFFFFALGHFVQTEGMINLLPPFVPFRKELVWLTGLLEIAIAIMLLLPATRRLGAAAAFSVLILFFPANVYGAMNAVEFGGHAYGTAYLLVRLPLQIFLLFWTYWFGLRRLPGVHP